MMAIRNGESESACCFAMVSTTKTSEDLPFYFVMNMGLRDIVLAVMSRNRGS
jgi:hypothetical protein